VDLKNVQISGFLNDFRQILPASEGMFALFFFSFLYNILIADMDKCNENSSGLFFPITPWYFLIVVFVLVDEPLVRPTEYLRQRCPLCFGGDNWFKSEEMCVF